MNYQDAMQLVKDGKMVRRKTWFDNIVIRCIPGRIQEMANMRTGASTAYHPVGLDKESDDWVEYEPEAKTAQEVFAEFETGLAELKTQIDALQSLLDVVKGDMARAKEAFDIAERRGD